MKALFVAEVGDEPKLEIREIPIPVPGNNEVLLKVASAGMCSHDVAIMRGLLRRGVDHNIILGHEIAGTVEGKGSNTDGVVLGDPVVTTLTVYCGECDHCVAGHDYRCRKALGLGHSIHGGFAEYIVVPKQCILPVPTGISLTKASIIACPMGVAFKALKDVAQLQFGETVLVTGAGGGLGVHTSQIAKALGAKVIASTFSEEKLALLERFTPGEVILGGELDFSEIVMALTEDRGVDIIIDTVGSAVFNSAIRSLGQFGRMVLLGEIEGGHTYFNLPDLIFRDASVTGSTGANISHIRGVMELMMGDKLESIISHKVPLEEATEAYFLIHRRESFGRVVLVP